MEKSNILYVEPSKSTKNWFVVKALYDKSSWFTGSEKECLAFVRGFGSFGSIKGYLDDEVKTKKLHGTLVSSSY